MHWDGDMRGVMTRNRSVTATFNAVPSDSHCKLSPEQELTTGWTSSPSGINCGNGLTWSAAVANGLARIDARPRTPLVPAGSFLPAGGGGRSRTNLHDTHATVDHD